MTDCRRCGGRATDAFLCRSCVTSLTKALGELPWWLARLTETAIGQTKMSDNAGRKSARRKDLDGDAELASCIEQLPPGDDLDKARAKREKAALAHALATGGVNAKASELLSEIADSLAFWCRVLCEARGLQYHPLRSGFTLGANHARWLLENVAAIGQFENAEDIVGDIETWTDDIRKTINRPMRWWALGECPGADEECGSPLRVPENTEEVKCRQCGARHNVHRLLLSRKSEAENQPMTQRQLLRYNKELPPEFQVPPRTLQHWLHTGRLCACSEGDDPLYSWIDVRLLMLDKPQRLATGGAAHRRGS